MFIKCNLRTDHPIQPNVVLINIKNITEIYTTNNVTVICTVHNRWNVMDTIDEVKEKIESYCTVDRLLEDV
jgi:DNA-binding LytR/AlgR family response regulator